MKSNRAAVQTILFSLLAINLMGASEDGFRSLFDGRSLAGWETPDASYWVVDAGAITGRITKEHPCPVNQYLVWQGGELADFELKLKSRVNGEGGINNGFQFRSRLLPDHDVCGYQVDNNLQTPWLVRLYDEFGRHTLAWRGERADFDAEGSRVITKLAEAEGPAWFRLEDWHEYHLTCVGPRITLRVDGRLAAEVEDNDPRRRELQGILALQLHSGPPTVVKFKDIRLKVIKAATKRLKTGRFLVTPRQLALRREAIAWWPLDTGGHGAQPPLRHIPGWEKFELNVRAAGPGASANTDVVVLDGAYFDAGPDLSGGTEALTVYVRARDPRGVWDAALFGKRGSREQVQFNLFGTNLPETPGGDLGFEIRTDRGWVMVSFPVSQIAATAWLDLVGRFDGKTLDLFCDGRRMAGKPWSGDLQKNSEPLLIGAETDAGKVVRHFRGELEAAALWSRALTDDELAMLSGVEKPGKAGR
ncbi:MAG: DUF1080 domain-containing protein [Verrucomicrobia subdivision 3 bacterium]|nr:DUF1080 domain-containing protein [Verrucomicrobiota bacterium]MCC6823815.1 DUF1080 domain-containing protein [Limisphaerales bacterium]